MNCMDRKKSRNISILSYFNILQIEYLQAELRSKIYPKKKDKKYWGERVMEGKKTTIEEIAERNNIPSIFTDETMLREFQKKIYRDKSYPLFTYRDQEQKEQQEYLDLKYYYYVGSEVRIETLNEVMIGKVSREYTLHDQLVYVEINGKEEKFPVSEVTRVL